MSKQTTEKSSRHHKRKICYFKQKHNKISNLTTQCHKTLYNYLKEREREKGKKLGGAGGKCKATNLTFRQKEGSLMAEGQTSKTCSSYNFHKLKLS